MEDSQQIIGTVSRVNNYIKRLLDSKSVLSNLWVKGEISNYKRHSSGHIYLTMKDESSVLKDGFLRDGCPPAVPAVPPHRRCSGKHANIPPFFIYQAV